MKKTKTDNYMKSCVFLSLLFTISSIASINGQHVFPERYDDCNSDLFFLEGNELMVAYEDEELLNDIIDHIDPKTLDKIRGEIFFQVHVDTTGNHCCLSIMNKLNGKGKKVDFREIINQHTQWGVPYKDGKKTAVSSMIKIRFLKHAIIIRRLGYHGKDGWIQYPEFVFGKN